MRAECLEELSDILCKFGMDVVAPAKNLHTIAQMLTDRDSAIRTAAGNFLVHVYEVMGAEIWKYLGKLPDASREALETKFSGKGPAVASATAAPVQSTAVASGIRPPSRTRGSVDVRASQTSTLVRQQSAPSKAEFSLELGKLCFILKKIAHLAQTKRPFLQLLYSQASCLHLRSLKHQQKPARQHFQLVQFCPKHPQWQMF